MSLFGKKRTLEGSLKNNGVIYLGRRPYYPQQKNDEIAGNIMSDHLFLRSGNVEIKIMSYGILNQFNHY